MSVCLTICMHQAEMNWSQVFTTTPGRNSTEYGGWTQSPTITEASSGGSPEPAIRVTLYIIVGFIGNSFMFDISLYELYLITDQISINHNWEAQNPAFTSSYHM